MKEQQQSGLGDRMNDFGFEVVSPVTEKSPKKPPKKPEPKR
jgi:hypothetical protein